MYTTIRQLCGRSWKKQSGNFGRWTALNRSSSQTLVFSPLSVILEPPLSLERRFLFHVRTRSFSTSDSRLASAEFLLRRRDNRNFLVVILKSARAKNDRREYFLSRDLRQSQVQISVWGLSVCLSDVCAGRETILN